MKYLVKNLLIQLALIFLLVACQKEKIPPMITFTYEIAENGTLTGAFSSETVTYQIDFGDGSVPKTGKAINNVPTEIVHKYTQKGTFTITITANNENGTATQKKEVKINSLASKPNAAFSVVNGDDGNVTIEGNLNEGDVYIVDFGDGFIVKDTSRGTDLFTVHHQFQENNSYILTLKVTNSEGSASATQNVTISNVVSKPIADFSYKILENGRVEFTNLSKNAKTYEWSITRSNGIQYPTYIATEQDINVNIDLSGYYLVKLDAIGNSTYNRNTQEKTIRITNAKKQMEFNGMYNGSKVIGSLESNELTYYSGWITLDGKGLYQSIANDEPIQARDLSKNIFSKFYNLYKNSNSPEKYNDDRTEVRYQKLKDYFTQSTDTDVQEVTEETLDTSFYNNTKNFYPKAFWVKYKVKNENLDGELKVRILVFGLN